MVCLPAWLINKNENKLFEPCLVFSKGLCNASELTATKCSRLVNHIECIDYYYYAALNSLEKIRFAIGEWHVLLRESRFQLSCLDPVGELEVRKKIWSFSINMELVSSKDGMLNGNLRVILVRARVSGSLLALRALNSTRKTIDKKEIG